MTFDGTSFNNQNTNKLFNILDKSDLHKYSDEILYNGFTGEQILLSYILWTNILLSFKTYGI